MATIRIRCLRRVAPRYSSAGRARCALAWLLLALPTLRLATAAEEYGPKSPEVVEMAGRALQYLETANEGRVGGQALIALAFVKAQGIAKLNIPPGEEHPMVKRGAEAVAQYVKQGLRVEENDPYTIGVSLVFLLSLDSEKYRAEIDALMEALLKRQKKHGGWGYSNQESGDTSMTQYAALSMWEAGAVGIDTPIEPWERLIGWLMRTQDPKGFWGYQGRDPGNFELVPQSAPLEQSMAAAGLGSVYICIDHLRLRGPGLAAAEAEGDSVIKKHVDKKKGGAGPALTDKVPMTQLAGTVARGDGWFKSNLKIDNRGFIYYYMYALERYESFKDATKGKFNTSGGWYKMGVEFLRDNQKETGAWNSSQPSGEACDTAFALLFLLRSTQKAIQKREKNFGAGTLETGRLADLGKGKIEVKKGVIKAQGLKGPAGDMISILNDPKNQDFAAAVSGLEEAAFAPDDPQLANLKEQLQRLAQGGDPAARRAAVQVLGRARNLNDVPTLIFALSDPDPSVMVEARNALEYVSRKLRGMGPEDDASQADVQAAIKRWKNWYLSIRPDAKFLE